MPTRLIFLLLLLGTLLGGCGGGAPAGPTATPAPTATPTPLPSPEFGPITFGLGYDKNSKIVRPYETFPEGIHRIFASFNYENMTPETEWRREWYWNGTLQEAVSVTEPWGLDKHGTTWVNTSVPDGLLPGDYELRLYIDGEQVQGGSFVIDERRPDTPVFKPITFAAEVTEEFEPIDPTNRFEEGLSRVHGVFTVEGLALGDSFERVWYVDGQEVLRATETADDESDRFSAAIFVNEGTLDPGTYTLEIYHDGKLAQGGSFTVGDMP